jgi:hypothetical protein
MTENEREESSVKHRLEEKSDDLIILLTKFPTKGINIHIYTFI